MSLIIIHVDHRRDAALRKKWLAQEVNSLCTGCLSNSVTEDYYYRHC